MPTRAGSFATFLIIGPTCFFLGILFILLPYDYYVLWSVPPGGDRMPYFDMQETNLKILHRSPPLVARILNLVIGTGLLGFVLKLYKPSEANMLFDGASLVLYMVGVIVYVSNIVRGLRAATNGLYGGGEQVANKVGMGVDDELLSREDSLRVMAASNTILALVLVGVLVLQAGQWYAQHKEEEEVKEWRKKRAEEHAASGTKKSNHGHGHAKKKAN